MSRGRRRRPRIPTSARTLDAALRPSSTPCSAQHGSIEHGFTLYDKLTHAPRSRRSAAAVDALSEPLSRLTTTITSQLTGREPTTAARPRTSPGRRGVCDARAFLGVAAGGAAAIGLGRRRPSAARRRRADGRAPAPAERRGSADVPVHGRAPGGDRDARAGPDVHSRRSTSRRRRATSWSTLLRRWTTMAARLTAGLLGRARTARPAGPYDAPPDDTGEAMDLPPAGLTITIGFGRSLFVGPERRHPVDRFGLARPARRRRSWSSPTSRATTSTPRAPTATSSSRPAPTTRRSAMHAVRNLTRTAFGTARVRWSQLGFGRTSSTSTAQVTPRNLLGFKDGTANVKAEETADVEQHVWVQPGDEGCTRAGRLAGGGSYLVVAADPDGHRDLGPLGACASRSRSSGGPRPRARRCRAARSSRSPTSARQGGDGKPLIAADSHVRLAHPSLHGGRADAAARLQLHGRQRHARAARRRAVLRRRSSRDPRTGFIPIQDAARADGRAERVPGAHGVGPVRGAAGRDLDRADGTLVGDDYLGAGLFA